MEIHLVIVLISFQLINAFAVSPQEVYWQSVLPTTSMPKVLQDLLPSEKQLNGRSFEDNAMDINIGDIVNVNMGNGVSVGVDPPFMNGGFPFLFNYGASEDQLGRNKNTNLFFLETDLHPNKKLNLYFANSKTKAKFLPRKVAETIPFSSNKYSQILHKFFIKPNSRIADVMKKTIEECEMPAIEDEDRYCATSLEAMVDFTISKLGKNVQVLATQTPEDNTEKQKFTITQGVRKVGRKLVSCHVQNYIYPVFFCHETHSTRAYIVPLIGDDQTKFQAIAICHTDTSKWNMMHLAFQALKVKPGTIPICHFLPTNHIAWVAK